MRNIFIDATTEIGTFILHIRYSIFAQMYLSLCWRNHNKEAQTKLPRYLNNMAFK